jgi:hypothetical protein
MYGGSWQMNALYQEAGRTILRNISMANPQMESVEWMGMIETIYRKAKISQAKSAGNKDDLLKRINPRSGSKEPLSTKWALNPKGYLFALSLGLHGGILSGV